jgi:hypothetical protein
MENGRWEIEDRPKNVTFRTFVVAFVANFVEKGRSGKGPDQGRDQVFIPSSLWDML